MQIITIKKKYSKPYNREQTNYYVSVIVTLNHMVYKLSISRIVTWSYIRLHMIIMSY